jgi:hypothetical protein
VQSILLCTHTKDLMASQDQIIIRQSARHDVCLRGLVRIAPESAGIVKFARASGAKDGWCEVDIVDLSSGGVGFISMLFLPRRTLLTLQVFGNVPEAPPLATFNCRIQRVCMTDRRPAYLIGAAVELPDAEARTGLERLLMLFENPGAA